MSNCLLDELNNKKKRVLICFFSKYDMQIIDNPHLIHVWFLCIIGFITCWTAKVLSISSKDSPCQLHQSCKQNTNYEKTLSLLWNSLYRYCTVNLSYIWRIRAHIYPATNILKLFVDDAQICLSYRDVVKFWKLVAWKRSMSVGSWLAACDLFAPVAFCGHSRVQSKCSKGCVCVGECDRIVVTVSLDNSRLGWLTLCQEWRGPQIGSVQQSFFINFLRSLQTQ